MGQSRSALLRTSREFQISFAGSKGGRGRVHSPFCLSASMSDFSRLQLPRIYYYPRENRPRTPLAFAPRTEDSFLATLLGALEWLRRCRDPSDITISVCYYYYRGCFSLSFSLLNPLKVFIPGLRASGDSFPPSAPSADFGLNLLDGFEHHVFCVSKWPTDRNPFKIVSFPSHASLSACAPT